MASTINKVVIIGNVGKDPDIRLSQNGNSIANLSVATSDSWRDKSTGERKERTEWHKIVVFVPQLVDVIKKYCHKGSKIYIEGSLQTRKWVDQTGVEKYITEIVVQSYSHTIVLLDSNEREGFSGSSGHGSSFGDNDSLSSERNGSDMGMDFNEEIPF